MGDYDILDRDPESRSELSDSLDRLDLAIFCQPCQLVSEPQAAGDQRLRGAVTKSGAPSRELSPRLSCRVLSRKHLRAGPRFASGRGMTRDMAYRGYMVRINPITGLVWIEKDETLIGYASGWDEARARSSTVCWTEEGRP